MQAGGGQAFVYGTLMADEVLKLLLKRVPPSAPATLRGYRRHGVRGQVYPAIVPAEGTASVRGKVLMHLTPKELNILDVYEAEEYHRATVQPLLDDGTSVEADAYILKDEFRGQLQGGDWCYQGFLEQELPAYLDMSRDFMREFFPDNFDG